MQVIDLEIIDIKRILSERAPKALGDHERYSVLVPLVRKEGILNLLFEIRSPGLVKQPGEVCFPGGKMEAGETAAECALREASEELGINAGEINIIAELDTIYAYSNFIMHSFLGEISHDALICNEINKKEVESVFYIPLPEFLESEPYIHKIEVAPQTDGFPYDMIDLKDGYDWRKGIYEVPIYRFGEKVIWGLTARIAHNLAKILRG